MYVAVINSIIRYRARIYFAHHEFRAIISRIYRSLKALPTDGGDFKASSLTIESLLEGQDRIILLSCLISRRRRRRRRDSRVIPLRGKGRRAKEGGREGEDERDPLR